MRKDLRLQEVLSDLTRARLSNFVVRKVELRDRLVEHQALDQNANQIVVNQVAWQ